MIGAVVVLFNPNIKEIININTYKNSVDYVVIVDNSEDDNEELVKNILNNYERITYYSEHKNMGLCRGLNIGIDQLRNLGCKWALLFDADSVLGSDIISIYKKAIFNYKNQQISLFAPVHIYDRSKTKPYKGYKEVSWSMTSGWIVNIEIFVKQKGFFEELFVDGLDMDYCFKSQANGYKVIECGEAIIKHNPAETRTFLGFKYGIALPFRYFMQARQLVWCWKRYKKPKMFLTYLYKWFKVVFLFPNKKEYIIEMNRGTREGNELVRRYACNEK